MGQLATLIKRKYPQYNDIPDDELERRVLAKYPQYRDLVDTTPTAPQPSFRSRLSESFTNTAKGIGGMAGTLAKMNPVNALRDSIMDPEGFQQTANEVKEIGMGALAPIIRPIQGFREGGFAGAGRGLVSGGLEFLGADPQAVKEDWNDRNFPALAGDLMVPTVLAAGGGMLARRGRVKKAPTPSPILDNLPTPPTPPDLPQPRLLGGMTPEGYLRNDGSLINNPEPFIEGQVITPESRMLGTGLTDELGRIQNRPEPLALPARGETSVPNPRFTGHEPTGKVGDVLDPNTPETLQALDLDPPGTADIIDAQRAADDRYRPDSRVTIEPPPPVEPWDFDTPTSRQKGSMPDPHPYGVPHVAGIQDISTRRKTRGEVTSRDYITEQGNIFSTVPDRLRPEVPNVTRFKDDAARVTPDLEPPVKASSVVELDGSVAGQGRGRKKGPLSGLKPLPELDAPSVPKVRQHYEEGGRVVEPPKLDKPYDPNKVDITNRRLSQPEVVYGETVNTGSRVFDRIYDRNTSKTNRAARDMFPKSKNPKKEMKGIANEVSKAAQSAGVVTDPPTVGKLVKEAVENSKFGSVLKTVRKTFSPTARLERLGPAGKKISTMLKDANTAARALGGKYDSAFNNAFKGLSKEQNSQVIKLLDGQLKVNAITDQSVVNAYRQARQALNELGELAEQAGVTGHAGRPFKRMEGEYFPHMFDSNQFPKESFLKQLVDDGLSIDEANRIIKGIRDFDEFRLSFQKGRFKDLPGYIEDTSVLTKYAYDMAQKIEYTKRFGARDIADRKSVISELAKQTTNVDEAAKLLSRYFNRVDKPDVDISRVGRAVVKAQVATKLSLSALNQLADVAMLPVRTSFTDFTKGLTKAILDAENSKSTAMRSGNLAILRTEALKELGAGTKFGKIYGLTAIESKLRTIQSIAGRSYAQSLFEKLKKNPNNKTLRHRMSQFVEGGDLDSILNQDTLTDAQLDFAAGRTSELTAGVPDNASLPPAFNDPILRIPLLFQRFAYLTTKNLKDIIIKEPTMAGKVAKTAQALAAYQIAGEVTGNLKEIAKGLVDAVMDTGPGIEERIASRGKEQWYDTGNDITNRMIANALQSWFFGFLGDKLEAGGRGDSGYMKGVNALKNLAGPVGGDIVDAWSLGSDLVTDMIPGGQEGKFLPNLKRQTVKRIPFIGQALNEHMKEEQNKRRAGKPSF